MFRDSDPCSVLDIAPSFPAAESPFNSSWVDKNETHEQAETQAVEAIAPITYVSYEQVKAIRPSGWICSSDGHHLNPLHYKAAPLAPVVVTSSESSCVDGKFTHEQAETHIERAIAALHHKVAELEAQGIRSGWVEESSVVKPNGKIYKQFHYCSSAAHRKYIKKNEVAEARAEISRYRRIYSINQQIQILEQVRMSLGGL
jgi:hypothetical protein